MKSHIKVLLVLDTHLSVLSRNPPGERCGGVSSCPIKSGKVSGRGQVSSDNGKVVVRGQGNGLKSQEGE